MTKKRYIIKLDPLIAQFIDSCCPQMTVERSLALFVESQYYALMLERANLLAQQCPIILPVDIVDTLNWMYPGLLLSTQITYAVHALADLTDINHATDLDYWREIIDLQKILRYRR